MKTEEEIKMAISILEACDSIAGDEGVLEALNWVLNEDC